MAGNWIPTAELSAKHGERGNREIVSSPRRGAGAAALG
jgi:hypothetical protein